MAIHRILGAYGLGAALLAACSSSGPTPGPGNTDPLATEAGFCAAMAGALCNSNVVTACYGSTADSLAKDTASCVAAYAQASHCNPQHLPYHEAGAQHCIDVATTTYANARLTTADIAAMQQACLGALSNTGGQNVHCQAASDCDATNGLTCVIKSGTSGTCQIPTQVMPGQKCSDPAAQCQTDYYCDPGQHCVAAPTTGDKCDPMTAPCDSKSLCTAGSCVAKKDNGASCAADQECSGGFCLKPTGGTGMGKCSAQLVLSQTTADSCDAFIK